MTSGHCPKCGTWRERLHKDHIVPKWNGGTDDVANHQYLCANCHEDKTRAEHKSPEYQLIVRPRQRAGIKASWSFERREAQGEIARKRESFSMKGRRHTDATRQQMSESMKGKTRVIKDKDAWRERLSIAAKKQWRDGNVWAKVPELVKQSSEKRSQRWKEGAYASKKRNVDGRWAVNQGVTE